MTLGRTLVALAGAVLCAGMVALSAAHVAAPQRDGPLALSQILAPYLFLLAVPFLLLARTAGLAGRLLRWGLLAAAVVFAIRFVPGWVSLPAATASAGEQLSVATWNLELGQPATDTVLETLRGLDAQVIGIQELTPWHADAIRADPTLRSRFPTMVLRPSGGSRGIGLLSTLQPLGEPALERDPPIVVQRLAASDGTQLDVVVAHPLPGRIELAGPLPIDYDASSRDRHIAQVRAQVDPLLGSGRPLLVIGDFNVVDREPAWADLVAGLTDAQRAVGLGPGHTWRPPSLEWLPFGLLRIDLLLAGNGVTPVSIAVDCAPRGSDHCLVTGVMALPGS